MKAQGRVSVERTRKSDCETSHLLSFIGVVFIWTDFQWRVAQEHPDCAGTWDQAQVAHDVSALVGLVDDNFVNTEWDGTVANKEQFLRGVKNPLLKADVSQIETAQVTLYGVAL